MNGALLSAMRPPAPSGWTALRVWLWAASPLVLCPFFEWLVVGSLPFPTGYMIMLPGLFVLPALVALGFVLLGPFLLIPRHSRRQTLRRWGLCVVFVAATLGGLQMAAVIRNTAFLRLAHQSSDLVSAIKRYASTHGQPPPSLDALVPEYLSTVPGTGMAAYPVYRYAAGSEAMHFDANPWMLWVNTPSGGINFDEFMYFPLQNYPQRGYGGVLQRIGGWAYLHE